MTDQPICGFGNVGGLGPCRKEREPGTDRCAQHDKVQYRVCVGCAGQAVSECGHEDGILTCRRSVCTICTHRADGDHGAPETAPSAPQETSPNVAATHVRDQLLAALTRSVKGCADRGLVTLPTPEHAPLVADVLLDELSAHALLGLLTGLAAKGAQG